jgi:hypothetical protein
MALWCVNCGSSSVDRQLFPIPTYAVELAACATCLIKFGADVLAEEADRWLAEHFSDLAVECMDKLGCLHCGGPIIMNEDGSRPLWCGRCNAELKKIREKG